jgi:hypothetical protein
MGEEAMTAPARTQRPVDGGVLKPMVCVDCAMRISATLREAKRHGWLLWVGGARCKSCVENGARTP